MDEVNSLWHLKSGSYALTRALLAVLRHSGNHPHLEDEYDNQESKHDDE